MDSNGWINPTCPHCECVMEFNYSIWTRKNKHVTKLPDLNMYCRLCHYAVRIKPAVISTDSPIFKAPSTFECYNSPQTWSMYAEEEE